MKRILIVRTDRVGDVVMITPMVRELRRTFPDAFIAALTQPFTQDILLHNPHINATIIDNLKKETFWAVVKELRKYKFTDGLLVIPTERAAYQMFFAGIKNRIGVGHKLYEVITFMKSVSRNNYIPLRHEADYCMDLARKIGAVTTDIHPEIFLAPEERSQALKLLSDNGILESNIKLYIHTGTRGSAPNWSENKYFRLIKTILEKVEHANIKIILTAKEMSNHFLESIESLKTNKVINISSQIHNLRELIRIISQADIFICSSTGPLHLADALNVKSIGIHCHRPMNCIKHWGILNGRSINLEVSGEFCRTHCSKDQNVCAIENGISIDEIIECLHTLLNKP